MNGRFITFMFLYIFFAMRLHNGFSDILDDRIINGIDCDIKSVPYMISFRLDGIHACGGVIINEKWALTAAHCVRVARESSESMSVCSGSSFLHNGTVHDVVDSVIHENYNDLNDDYDVAAIKVMPKFTYDNFTKPVNLADNVEKVSTEYGIASGWGSYLKTDTDNVSEHLKCVKLPKINKTLCQEDYKYKYELTPRMVCYGYQNGTADTCKGDSGGPLVNKNKILLGITSFGHECASPNSPGVYANMIFLSDWVKMHTGMHEMKLEPLEELLELFEKLKEKFFNLVNRLNSFSLVNRYIWEDWLSYYLVF